MEKFQLSILFNIIGIGSASGLLYHQDKLYIISDNSTFLYEFSISNESLNKIPLVDNSQENITKKDKPDFESITMFEKDIIILSSGSTEKRNKVIQYKTLSQKVKVIDFTELYLNIKNQLDINDEELNIEGLITIDNAYYFFQRGNSVTSKNVIIYAEDALDNQKFNFIPFDLPKIKNVTATFTDAIIVDDKIYFLAAAEDTSSTYDDGAVMGSIIGTINLKTLKLENYIQISDTHKFEGLTLYKKSATQIELLLCEDADTEILETSIYKLMMEI